MHALVCFQPVLRLGVTVDFALGQRLCRLVNLCLGGVGVVLMEPIQLDPAGKIPS
jgi:hypothetical protein